MEYFLFAGYLVLFAWLVTKTTFFKRSGLNNAQLVIIFLVKIMAGIFYGWVGIYYGNHAQMVDTWSYHYNSLRETQLLYSDPHEYFINLFRNHYEGGVTKFLDSTDSYWNDLKSNVFIKILSIFNIFSFGNYYTNVILYSFISMFGPVAIFRVMNDAYPGKKYQIVAAVFLIPSFVYWSSGLHKEGLIFLGFSLVIYNIYFSMQRRRVKVPQIIFILIGLLLVVVLRNFLLVILVPALVAWCLADRYRRHAGLIYAGCYVFFVICFFTAKYIHPKLDFPQAVVTKQKEFVAIVGVSSVPMRETEPTFSSFIANFPQSVSLSMLRPYLSDVRHLLSLAAASETDFLLLIFLLSLVWHANPPEAGKRRVFVLFCLFLSFSVLITIGYVVNNLGAIVRYRSIILPLLFTPVFCRLDWQRVGNMLTSNIRNKNNVEKIE